MRPHDRLVSCMLSAKYAADTPTVRHHVKTVELRKTISRNLSELRRPQRVLMPGLGPILDEMGDDEDPPKLFLPSDLSAQDRSAWCLPDTSALEFRFRYAQADNNLAELRRLLRLFQNLRSQNSKHPSLAQKALTRTKGLFNSFRTRIRRAADRYSRARNAMLALDPDEQLSPGWTKRFQKLNDNDVRGPGREPEDASEGQFTPSWIWLIPQLSHPLRPGATTPTSNQVTTAASTSGSTVTDSELNDSMRAHWAKCQARAERYEEEVALTIEEMGRTLRYFEWKKSWWHSLQSERGTSDSPPPVSVQRRLQAYTLCQANVYEILTVSFVSRWKKTLLSLPHHLRPAWLTRYPVTADPQDHSQPGAHSKSAHMIPKPLSSPSPPFHTDVTGAPPTSEMEVSDDGDDNDGSEDDDGDDSDGDDYESVDNVEVSAFDFEDDAMA